MSPRTERLEKGIARVARDHGVDQERLRRWISFLAICGVLEKAVQANEIDFYYLKGGVALELRYARQARATKDLDLGLGGNRKQRLEALVRVLELGFDDFTFRLKASIREMEQADTVRIEIAVAYRTRNWQTIEVDLGPATQTTVDLVHPQVIGLGELGLPIPSPIRCLNLAEQIAQKLHACTAPGVTGRARDILDILLIDMLGELEYADVADAAHRVFTARATHSFPPTISLSASWKVELEALATGFGFPQSGGDEMEEKFQRFVEKLSAVMGNTVP